jgi:hypothetical protein
MHIAQQEFMKQDRAFGIRNAALLVVIIVILIPAGWARGNFKSLHRFGGGGDGRNPRASLVSDQAGSLYGTTVEAGSGNGEGGGGTVFKLTPNADGSWTESMLYSFCSLTNCADGDGPASKLIFDAAGNLYGTTSGSGQISVDVVFKLKPNSDGSWTESVLHTFCSAHTLPRRAPPRRSHLRPSRKSLWDDKVWWHV